MSVDLLPYSPDRDIYRLLRIEPEADTSKVLGACVRFARGLELDGDASEGDATTLELLRAITHLMFDGERRAAYDAGRRRYVAMWHEVARLGTGPGAPACGPEWLARSPAARLRRGWG